MVRSLVQEVLPVPPSIDDIVAAVKQGKTRCSESVKSMLAHLQNGYAGLEQFNFGPLSLDTVREAQKEAVDFVEWGHFVLPYPVCYYRATIAYENVTVGMGVLLIEDSSTADLGGISAVSLVRTHDNLYAIHSVNLLRTRDEGTLGKAVELKLLQSEIDYWTGKGLTGSAPSFEEVQWQMTEGSLVGMALTMIVNTKGVLKRREAPPEKPNKARAKAGRPLLPYTTRVYTSVYNAAVAPGEAGTHASPRAHRRRAHIRHIPERNGKAGYNVPIAAMLVNWDGKPLEAREEYKIR